MAESCAAMDWSRAVTLPETTLGAPPTRQGVADRDVYKSPPDASESPERARDPILWHRQLEHGDIV